MPFLAKRNGDAEASGLEQSTLVTGRELPWGGFVHERSTSAEKPNDGELSSSVGLLRRLCGNTECANGWAMPWRNRKRPIFEAQWGCSGRCVLGMVQAAVRRELGEGRQATVAAPHRHRVPLGLLMLAQGWITHPELRRALAAQRESGIGRIGDWLIRECGIEPEQVVRGLSMQWGCPVLTTEGFAPESMALTMPLIFVEEFGLLPLRVAASRILYLGFADRLDASAAFAAERMMGFKVESGVVEGSQFEAARGLLLACDGVEMRRQAAKDKDTMAVKITAIIEQQQPIASRLVRLHQYYWLRLWLERGALGKVGILPATKEDILDYVFTIGEQR